MTLFFQFSHFETEKVFDTVQILGGGRTEETATNIATLSGSLEDIGGQSFTSASNFMIIKFRSDESEEKSGFHASWITSTEGQSCGGDLNALASPQILASPGYNNNPSIDSEYPGGLECLHIIKAPKGQIITMEIEDFDMEPDKDFVLVRDGDNPDSPKLKTLTGKLSDNPQFVVSTGNRYSSVLILRLMYIELARVLTIVTLNHLYLITTSFNDLCKPYRVVK